MLILAKVLTLVLVCAVLWPQLPISRYLIERTAALALRIKAKVGLGRALLGISLALLLFAAIWALQGDAPIFLAMALPEVAAWLTTFEIATVVDALVGVGSAYVAIRASGAGNYLKGRARARRARRSAQVARKASNDDEPGGLALAA